jgi:hypothetical protein
LKRNFRLRILFISFSILLFSGCNIKEDIKESKPLSCLDIFNADYIKSAFKEVKIIPLSHYRSQSNDAQNCGYTFSIGDTSYDSSLILESIGEANATAFEHSIASFEDKKFLMGFGEQSYLYPLGFTKQISILSHENILHAYITEDNGTALTFDKSLTKKLLIDMLKKLE